MFCSKTGQTCQNTGCSYGRCILAMPNPIIIYKIEPLLPDGVTEEEQLWDELLDEAAIEIPITIQDGAVKAFILWLRGKENYKLKKAGTLEGRCQQL